MCRRLIPWTACAVAAACTVGPDYVRPEMPMPSAWAEELAPGVEAVPFDHHSWWQELHDPLLVALMQRGVRASPTLNAAYARIQQSRAVLGKVVGEIGPDVDATGDYTRLGNSDRQVVLPSLSGGNFSLGGALFWEIDLFGRIRRSIESADAGAQATVEDFRDVLVSLQAEIARRYVEVRTLQHRIIALDDSIARQRASLALARTRHEAGEVSELDVVQAESILAGSASRMPVLRRELAFGINRLATLIGEHSDRVRSELAVLAPIPDLPPRVRIGLPAELLSRRPDVRRAERALAAQVARIGAAEALAYPRINVLGSLELVSTHVDSLFRDDSATWAVSPGFAWNLFDLGRVRATVAEQGALANEALMGYRNAVLLAAEETENALAAYRLEGVRRAALQRWVRTAERQVDLAEELYGTGRSSFQELLDAQRTLALARDRATTSRGRAVKALITLYAALGGGWQRPADADDAETDDETEPDKNKPDKNEHDGEPGAG